MNEKKLVTLIRALPMEGYWFTSLSINYLFILFSRYLNQKYRLTKSGLKHIIYLIEGNTSYSKFPKTLEFAMADTQVFFIIYMSK